MRIRSIASLWTLAAALPGTALAQTAPSDPTELASSGSAYYRVQDELAQWREVNGENWRVVFDEQTGAGSFLYGGATAAQSLPRSDADFIIAARNALAASQSIHGLDLGTLVEQRATFLPLGNAGSTDKMTVNFRQEVNGVRVLGGYANVLFDLQGRLLSVDSTGLPSLAGFSTTPGISDATAIDAALALFATDSGLPPTSLGTPELVIDQKVQDGQRLGKLAWQVEVLSTGADSEAEGFVYRIDAFNGELVSRQTAIHNFDVSGTVRAMATPGVAGDSASNPEQQIVMPYLRITSAQGNAVTDSNGNFTIVGASAPLNATVTFDGTFCSTNNQAQADYSLGVVLNSASGNSILMNPGAADLVTAEANGLNWLGQMRDWTRAINPADATSDFLATSNVNIASTCNAYYDGSSINFYQAGGGCPNTAFSSVVLHETGHWLNDRYGSGNGSDGFGEGNADNYSTHILDDPIVGKDFCGVGCNVRDANNLRQFCGDNNGGCYGEVHADGEVLMGALWKVRLQLKSSLGAAAGVLASDTFLNAWMNAYNDSQIKTIIETHYLTLDDNDGNINNGTPNYPAIDAGFKIQGFPGFALSFVSFSNVTVLPNTQDETGPYVVNADIVPTFTPPVLNPQVRYRVNGGGFQTLAMAPTGGSGYTASIPGQVAPSKVEYYLTATDGAAQSGSYPDGGALKPIKFLIGVLNVYFTTDFESGVNGWTHGSNGGTQDDWMISSQFPVDTSYGKVGDPTSAASGTVIWGNDLGPSGFNGEYSTNVSNFLRSPFINLSGATNSTLVLQRWLQVQGSGNDKATIKVNGTQVWINPTTTLLDNSWNEMEIDISSLADGNPSVQLEFGLVTDGATNYGGWNIDDVEIRSLTGSGCQSPTSYCVSKLTSTFNLPVIGSLGAPSQSSGNFQVSLSGAIGNTPAIVIWGPNQASVPFNGGTLCLGAPITRGPLQFTDGAGSTTFAVSILPAMVGTTLNYQWWFRDVADAQGTGLSNGLRVTFCN